MIEQIAKHSVELMSLVFIVGVFVIAIIRAIKE